MRHGAEADHLGYGCHVDHRAFRERRCGTNYKHGFGFHPLSAPWMAPTRSAMESGGLGTSAPTLLVITLTCEPRRTRRASSQSSSQTGKQVRKLNGSQVLDAEVPHVGIRVLRGIGKGFQQDRNARRATGHVVCRMEDVECLDAVGKLAIDREVKEVGGVRPVRIQPWRDEGKPLN